MQDRWTPDETAPGEEDGLLNRLTVVQAALDAADEHGLPELALSRIAERLGVDEATVRRIFPHQQQLLDAVATRLLHDVLGDTDTDTDTAAAWGSAPSWQGYLHGVALAWRRVALSHLSVVALVATPASTAPWLWPPVRDVAFVEQLLTTLLRYGMNDRQAVLTYRAFVTFLNGWLLLEVDSTPAGRAEAELGRGSGHASSAGGHPVLLRLRPLLEDDRNGDEFEAALEALLDRLERDLSGLADQSF